MVEPEDDEEVMLYRLMQTMRERNEDTASRRTLEGAQIDAVFSRPPLIIGGTGGSGTQAVSRVLTHASYELGHNLNSDNDSLDVAEFLGHWVPQWIDAGNADLGGAKQERMDRHFRAALIRLRGDDIDADAKWLVKNPRLMYLLPFLNRQFPAFKFLHVIRDGRDMSFSRNQGQLAYLGSKYLSAPCDKTNPVHSAKLWNKANLAAKQFGENVLQERYFFVRFEDLCEDPTGIADRIFAFLGVDGDAQEAGREIAQPKSIGRWRQEDPLLVTEVTRACDKALRAFGYSPNC